MRAGWVLGVLLLLVDSCGDARDRGRQGMRHDHGSIVVAAMVAVVVAVVMIAVVLRLVKEQVGVMLGTGKRWIEIGAAVFLCCSPDVCPESLRDAGHHDLEDELGLQQVERLGRLWEGAIGTDAHVVAPKLVVVVPGYLLLVVLVHVPPGGGVAPARGENLDVLPALLHPRGK